MVIHLITLSALIAAVLLVRVVFRKKVPARLIYALWLVVAVKLCMPFALFEVEPALPLTDAAAQTEQTAVQTQNVPEVTKVPAVTVGAAITPIVSQQPIASQEAADPPTASAAPIMPAEPIKPTVPVVPTVTEPTVVTPIETEVIAPEVPTVVEKSPIDWTHIAAIVWFAGSVAVAVWFAGTGAIFYQKLCADRCLHTTVGRTKVYISQSAGAPCLAGLLPAIYLTPSAAHSESKEFVIAHEYTHLRHGDHLWAALRTLALIVYWWNPLVWAAAIVSKQDAELACDEGVAAKLDDAGRIAYARTILDTIPQKHAHAVGLGGAPIKERLLMLTSKHKNRAIAAVLAVVLTLSAVGCSFIGPKETTEPVDDTPDLLSSIATTSSDTTEVTTTAAAVADTPDVPESPVRVLSNEGGLDIRTVMLPLSTADSEYDTFVYNDRYMLYTVYDKERNADGAIEYYYDVCLYIIDALQGEIVGKYVLDTQYRIESIAYTDEGCVLYNAEVDEQWTYHMNCAFSVTEENGMFTVSPTTIDKFPYVMERFTSPSDQHIVYRTIEDEWGYGGIDIKYPDGSVKRIAENTVFDNEIDGDEMGHDAPFYYDPIGFIDDVYIGYTIGGWESMAGYGIYNVATEEKTEEFGVYRAIGTCDGVLYVEERQNFDDGTYAIWEITPDGKKILLASKDTNTNVFKLPETPYMFFKNCAWCFYTPMDAETNYITELYAPDFSNKMAEIEWLRDSLDYRFNNFMVYENTVTIVVPYAVEKSTHAPVRVLSNEGDVEIHTVFLPVEKEDMQYRSFVYNERYSIYVTYTLTRSTNSAQRSYQYDSLYIIDAQSGRIVYTALLDVVSSYMYILNPGDICTLYTVEYSSDGETRSVGYTYSLMENDGAFVRVMVDFALSYPYAEQHLVSPDGTYIAYKIAEDAGGDGGIEILYPDGTAKRILDNVMLEEAADLSAVTGYHPVGFVEDTKLVYRIGGWSGTKGYGVYNLTTGEKTEVFEIGSNPCAVYDGAFYVEEWRSTMIVYEPEAVWKVTADGEKTKVASKDAADGVYVLSDDRYREFENSMWCLFDTGNTAGIEYGEETPDTLTVSLYSPDFDKKLCEIEYPHGGSAFDNVRVYGNSVTVVVMSAPARTYAERPLVSQYAYTSVEDFYGPDAVYSMDLTGDGVADTCTVKVLGHGTQYYEEGITVADGQSGKTIAVGDPEFYTNHHILLSATEEMYTVGVGDMLYYIDKSRLDTPKEHRGEVLHGNDIIDFMVRDNALICRVSLACGMSEVCAELIYTYTYTAGEFAVTGVRLCDLTTDKEIDFGTFAPTAYLPTDLTDSITYIDIGGAYMPVSYIQNGKQLLTGDAVYSMLAGDVLKDAPTADSLPKQKNLASDASWDLFPVEVVHAVYTSEEQPEETEWIEYFAEQLAEKDTPVILTESWSFTLEGKKAAVVFASNVIVSGDQDVLYTAGDAHAAPNAPAADNAVQYRMQAFFIEGSKPQRLYSEIAVLSEDYGISYRPTAFESYQQIFSALQYDASGKIVECPLFNNMNGWYALRDYAYRPEYTVCDIDGDGAVELLCYTEKASSDMSGCAVYRLEDGICIRVCTVALS